jgi:hypothetical protein
MGAFGNFSRPPGARPGFPPYRERRRVISPVAMPGVESCGLTIEQPSSGITVHMPDEYRLTPPRPDPERIDLAALKTDLEFVMEQLARLRRELALRPLYVVVGSAGLVTAWIELFWRHCL